jgi:hypothetical protein
MLKLAPEHIVAVCSGISGFGLTVIKVLKGAPTQAPLNPEVGVTVYETIVCEFVLFVSV